MPHTSARSCNGRIPGWKGDVEPVRHRSLFWHNIWMECGKPHTGPIADIMRKTRSAYHYTIRNATRAVNDKINQRFADAILQNKGRDFWDEVKRIRRPGTCCSSNVDDLIPLLLNTKICTPVSRMLWVTWQRLLDFIIIAVLMYLKYFKLYVGWNLASRMDTLVLALYFLHACNELCVYVSLLFSGLLIHRCVLEELSISTVIPIPKVIWVILARQYD